VNEVAAGLASSATGERPTFFTSDRFIMIVAGSAGGLFLLTLAGVLFVRKRRWKATWNAEEISEMYNADVAMYAIGNNPGEPGNFSVAPRGSFDDSRSDECSSDVNYPQTDLWDQFPRKVTSPFQGSMIAATARPFQGSMASMAGLLPRKVNLGDLKGASSTELDLESSAQWDAEVAAAVDMMKHTIGGTVGESYTNPEDELTWDESTFTKTAKNSTRTPEELKLEFFMNMIRAGKTRAFQSDRSSISSSSTFAPPGRNDFLQIPEYAVSEMSSDDTVGHGEA